MRPTERLEHSLTSLPQHLICFSHLRWDFVYQRPQHLLTRLAESMNVFYIEEPVFIAADKTPHYILTNRGKKITVAIPQLPEGLNHTEYLNIQTELFNDFMNEHQIKDYGFWYYTPMALEFSRRHTPVVTVFDCMDELSAFKFAPESIKKLEQELFAKADVVFTGGNSLYEAKKDQHDDIYSFPSSIEKEHFAHARTINTKNHTGVKSRPKLGFYGVIDERFDIDLISGIANAHPEWDLALVGPVVKIDPEILPRNRNIHYAGPKSYAELPDIIAGWDIALIPFLLNESTRFISPTKTPEYLAAGLPVISTPIHDVVNPYGNLKLVSIGQTTEDFILLAEEELRHVDKSEWLAEVDSFLSDMSWDITCDKMKNIMQGASNSAPVYQDTLARL